MYGSQDTYKNLIQYLEENLDADKYSVKFFPYDWLGDLNDSEKLLEEDIKASGFDKVIFVTHSTGGLLAANYIAQSELNRDKIEKAILVAPPLYGTYTALEPLEEGKTSSLASLLDKNLPEWIVNVKGLAYPAVYSWVRSTVKNTPTTYQLLPSLEYLKFMPQDYSEDMDSPVTNMTDYYTILKNSKGDLNENLLDGNENSHKYFRETVLGGDIRNILNQVDTTVIGNSCGYDTPAIAVYSKSFFGSSRKYKEIIYKEDGDGTVMGVSALLRKLPGTNDDGIQRIDMALVDAETESKLDHTGLVTEKEGIETIFACITGEDIMGTSSIEWVDDELYTTATASDEGMSDSIKLIIANNQETEIKITDNSGNKIAVASPTEMSGFNSKEGFIYNQLEGEEDLYLYQIYIPNKGYKVEILNTTEDAPNLQVSVATLDRDGYRLNTATYTSTTATDKLAASFDLVEKVDNDRLSKINSSGAEYKGTMTALGDWTIEESAFIDEIGKKIKLELYGEDASKIDVNKDIEWTSSDEKVAIVNGNEVTAKGYGTATIYAASKDGSGKIETCEVKVGKYPTSIYIEDFILVKGHRIQPEVVFEPADTNMKDIVYVSDDTNIIKVINDNTLLAVGEGTAKVTGTTENGLTAEFHVTVTASDTLYVDDVSIDPLVAVLSEDKKTEVIAKIVPETALNKTVTWAVIDESIASLKVNEDHSCTLTGLKEGVTKLTVLSDDGSYSDESTIVVGSILDVSQNNRMIMKNSDSKQVVLGDKDVYYPIVSAFSTDPYVADVTDTGMITAVSPGCALITLEGICKGKKISSSVQIEVTDTLVNVVDDVTIKTKSVKSNVYRKTSGSIELDIDIDESALGLFSTEDEMYVSENAADIHNVARAITSARFEDKTVDALFKLSVASDNILNINPNMKLTDEFVSGLEKKYTSKIIITVGGKQYTSNNEVSIEPDKKKPVIKTKAITVNTFFNDAKAGIPFTTDCGEVTEIKVNADAEGAIPDTLKLDAKNKEIVYTGGKINAGNTVKLLVKTKELRDFVDVNLNVKAKSTKPEFKLSASKISVYKQVEYNKGQELILKTNSNKKLLSDYNVANLALADVTKLSEKEQKKYAINNDYVLSEFNLEDGSFTIKPASSSDTAKSGTLLLQVYMYGTTQLINIPLKVTCVEEPKLKLSKKSLVMNYSFRNNVSASVKFKITPADYETKDLSVTVTTSKGVKTEDISAKISGNSIVVTPTTYADKNAVYIVKLNDGLINTSFKVKMKNNRASAKVSYSGKIDMADTSKGIVVKTKLKNITADPTYIRIVPHVYRYAKGSRYGTNVSDAFNVVSIGNGSYKMTLNTNSSYYKNGYISPSNTYKIATSVYAGDRLVSTTKYKKISITLKKQKMNINTKEINLTDTNKNLPVSVIASFDKISSENVSWEISGNATEFCDIINLGNGKYSIKMNPIMTKKDAKGKLVIKAYMPGSKKAFAQVQVNVTYTK